MASVGDNIKAINERIAEAALRSGRDPAEVSLIAVSKRQPIELIREAYDAGQRLFGENYIQEALGKMDQLGPEAQWHMIGHLQSNKAKRAVESFAMLHTVDRPSLADALQKAAAARSVELEVLLQLNVGGEASKAGGDEENAIALAQQATRWPNLKIKGLMAIPPWLEPEEVRPYFRGLRELAAKIAEMELEGVQMTQLSMGMSHDFEAAVEEGATLVRVGSALFGPRLS